MANVEWQISGEYFEACSCDSVCPCPTSGLAARPSKGYCAAGLVFNVTRGQRGPTKLDGLSFAVLLRTPGPMIKGDWTVGLFFDNVAHPAASRLALAKASRSHMHGFGIDCDDTSGTNNGHFAPFAWSSS